MSPILKTDRRRCYIIICPCIIFESNHISFADDTQIYTQIHDVSDCNLLQQDLNLIYDWASTNNMFF